MWQIGELLREEFWIRVVSLRKDNRNWNCEVQSGIKMFYGWLALQCCNAEPKCLLAICETKTQHSSAGVWYPFQRSIHQNSERTCCGWLHSKQWDQSSENRVDHLRLNTQNGQKNDGANTIHHPGLHAQNSGKPVWKCTSPVNQQKPNASEKVGQFAGFCKSASTLSHRARVCLSVNMHTYVCLRLPFLWIVQPT